MIVLYEYTRQPHFWIAHDAEGYWLLPVRNNGWHDRTPFVGRIGTLRKVKDLAGIDLGIDPGVDLVIDPGIDPGNDQCSEPGIDRSD